MARLGAFLGSYAFPIGLFAALRVWTLVWASAGAAVIPVPARALSFYYGLEPLKDAVVAPWLRWDTVWYVKLAIEGYARDGRIVFAPLFPFLIRVVRPLVLDNAVAAGLVISSLAAGASFILLFRLAREMFDETAARRTLLWLVAFPTAFFLFAAYTESLFLALVLGAFLCARGKAWIWAGVLGGLAAMTRPQGVLFLLPLGVEFWQQFRRGEATARQSLSLLLVGAGGLAQLAWLTWQFGTPAVWFEAQAVWHRATSPWEALGAGWAAVANAPTWYEAALASFDPLCAVVLLATLVWSWRRLPFSYTLYTATIILPPLFVVTTYSVTYPLTAVARYTLVAFPLFILLGSLRSSWWQALVAALMFLVQTLGLVLFAGWVFVR
jgi:hypothetical protein